MRLTSVLGSGACVSALREHSFTTADVDVEVDEVKPIHKAFPQVANDRRYDVGELAIVTFLQALDAGRPLCLLPVTLLGRFQHHCLVTMEQAGLTNPADLAGKRVGVRAWSQTTGVWVRGIAAAVYGLDLTSVEWIAYEDSHVPGVEEPAYVQRAKHSNLAEDFLSGVVDAAILGNGLPDDPRARTVLTDPAREAARWYADSGVIPLNHMLVASEDFLAEHPAVAEEVCRVVAAATPRTPRVSSTPDFYPSGFDAIGASLELVARYAYDQGVVSQPFDTATIRARTEKLSGLDLGQLAPEVS